MKRKLTFLMTCALTLSLFAGCGSAPESEETPEPAPQETEETASAGLPVISIHVEGGKEEIEKMNASEDHSYECKGTVDITVPEGFEGMESVSGLELDYIRGRGNSTWLKDKKPYKIKFEDGQDLFGLGSNKHYVLLANASDRSFILDRLTAYIGIQMGLEYTPDGRNVELYMNDEYLGNYYLSEQVRVGKNRVDIDELEEDDTAEPEIHGGYLLSINPAADPDDPNLFVTKGNVNYYNEYPSFNPEDEGYVNEAQSAYIRSYVQKCEDAIFDETNTDYQNLIDMKSAADYWLIQEVCQNDDAFRTTSTYLYKKRFEEDGSEGKLYFGPLWDFDRAWGVNGFVNSDPYYFNHATYAWINQLRDRDEFSAYLKERWAVLDKVLEEAAKDGGVIDQWYEENKDSYERDAEKWAEFYKEENPEDAPSYKEYIGIIKNWINGRRDWINENIDDIGKILVHVKVIDEFAGNKEVKVRTGSFLYAEMQPEEVDGYTFEGWYTEDGEELPMDCSMDEDMTIVAHYKKAE